MTTPEPKCANCNKPIRRQTGKGAWYHAASASASCWPGSGSWKRATPVEVQKVSGLPTPAQRQALLAGIANGGVVPGGVGASRSRMRANLHRAGWTSGGRITAAGYEAVDATPPEVAP